MKKMVLPGLLSLGLLVAGCDDNDLFPDRVTGSGPTITDTRSAADFSRVQLSAEATVYLTQGPAQHIRVEAQRNILDALETTVRDQELRIGFGRTRVRRHEAIRIYVTTPNLTGVAVSGAGQVVGQGPWQVQDLDLNVSGSGGIDLRLPSARDLRTRVSGSGAVRLAGTARDQQVHVSGSGQVDGFDLSQQTADADISGSGAVRLTVVQALRAAISGSGTMYYRGRPAITQRISGSGRVVDAN